MDDEVLISNLGKRSSKEMDVRTWLMGQVLQGSATRSDATNFAIVKRAKAIVRNALSELVSMHSEAASEANGG